MSKSFKDSLSGGLDSLISGSTPGEDQPSKGKPGRKKTNTKVIKTTSQEGTKEGETRATFIVNEEYLDKLKNIAYWDRLSIKDVVNAALGEYVTKYEKKNGSIKPQKQP